MIKDVHFSSQCVGVGLVVSKLGLVVCYCGVQDSSLAWAKPFKEGF